MKKFARGRFGRAISIMLAICWVMTSLMLPISQGIGHAASGGQQRVILMPFPLSVEGAPDSLVGQAQANLASALQQRRPGMQVKQLQKSANELRGALKNLDEAEKAELLKSYETAANSNASLDARTKAAAKLIDALQMDSLVFGAIDGYEVDPATHDTRVHVSATVVTLERDADGKLLKDAKNNLQPLAEPFDASGRTAPLPKSKVSQATLDSEAIANAIASLANAITGVNGAASPAVSAENDNQPSGGSSWKKWILPAIGLGILVVVASGGSGDKKSTPPPSGNLASPQITQANVGTYINGSGDTAYQIILQWDVPEGTTPFEFEIYRTEGTIAGRTQTSAGNPNITNIKAPPGRIPQGTDPLRAYDKAPRGSSFRQFSMADTASDTPFKVVPGNPNLSHFVYVDREVAVGKTYTYSVGIRYGSAVSKSLSVSKSIKTPSGIEVSDIIPSTTSGAVKLTWTAPAGMSGKKYKVYRTTALSSGTTLVTSDDLVKFVDISGPTDVPWGTNTFTDTNPVYGVNNYYVVVTFDSNGIQSVGPYEVSQIKPAIPPIVLVDTYTVTADKTRVYYSSDPDDMLSTDIVTQAILTINGVTADDSPAADATVKLTTSVGSFAKWAEDQTVSNDKKSIIGTLDSSGNMYVILKGRPDDGKAGPLVIPTANELGTPKIIAENLGLSQDLTGTLPEFIGTAANINVTLTAPIQQVPQVEPTVIFNTAGQTASIAITATDRNGKPVMAGTPIWIAPSWNKIDTAKLLDTTAKANAVGPGQVTDSVVLTDDNGQGVTAFRCDHSGVYTINAYALIKGYNSLTLEGVNNDPTTGSLDTKLTPTIKTQNLLPSANGSYVSNVSMTPPKITCKTLAKDWEVVSVDQQRIMYNDANAISNVTITAIDKDGKRVFPGVYFSASSYRKAANGNSIATGKLLDPATLLDLPALVSFDNSAKATIAVRGTDTIGKLFLQLDNKASAFNLWMSDTPVVTLCGPSLANIQDIPADPTKAAVVITPGSPTTITQLAGSGDTAATTPKSATIKITLIDKTTGIAYPRGVLFNLATFPATPSTGGLAPIQGETDAAGQFTVTYTAPDLTKAAVDQFIATIRATVTGESILGTETLVNPWTSNMIIKTERPVLGNLTFLDGSHSTYPANTTIPVEIKVTTTNGDAVSSGYPISFVLRKVTGAIDTTISANSVTTDALGFVKFNLVTGAQSGTIVIDAYYDKNNDGKMNQDDSNLGAVTNERIVTSGTLTVGFPAPTGFTVLPLVPASAIIQWMSVQNADGYLIERSPDGGNTWEPLDPNGTGRTVDGTTEIYTDANLIPGQTYQYHIKAVNTRDNVSSAFTVSKTVTVPTSGYVEDISFVTSEQKIYFSENPLDSLAATTTRTTITINGLDVNNLPAAGSSVTLTTTIGNFERTTDIQNYGSNGTDRKSITGILDADGKMTVVFLGRLLDDGSNRTAFKYPEANELGMPQFICYNYGKSIIPLGQAPILVGPPDQIVINLDVPAIPANAPQPDALPVVYAGKAATVKATVYDRAGQKVLPGMPIWTTQEYDRLTNLEDMNDPDYFNKAIDFLNINNSVGFTKSDGLYESVITSNHSGVYSIKLYALTKNYAKQVNSLNSINLDHNGGFTDARTDEVKDSLLQSSRQADVMASKDIMFKTLLFWNKWTVIDSSPPRIICDGGATSTITMVGKDIDDKYLCPGSYFTISPSIGQLVVGTNNYAPIETVQFDSKSQVQITVAGNPAKKSIGSIYLNFSNLSADRPETSGPSGVVLYGGALGPGVIPFDDGVVGVVYDTITLEPRNPDLGPVTRIAGSLDNVTAASPKSVKITVRLTDIYGNRYGAGYVILISSLSPFNALDRIGVTDYNGQCEFIYTGPNLFELGEDEFIDQLKFTITGENAIGQEVRSDWPGMMTIVTEHPHTGSISPMSPGTVVYPFGVKELKFKVNTWTTSGKTVLPGYPIHFEVKPDMNGSEASFVSNTVYTDNAGSVVGILNTGNKYGVINVNAYYDDNADGMNNGASENLASTNTIVIGLLKPSDLKVIADPDNCHQMIITWGDPNPYEDNIILERSADGWKTFTQVSGKPLPADTTSYVDTGLAAGTKYQYRLTAIADDDGAGIATSNATDPVEGITIPDKLDISRFSIAAISNVQIDMSWAAVAGATKGYEIRRSIDPNAAEPWPIIAGAVADVKYQDKGLTPGTTYYYQFRAVGDGGVSEKITVMALTWPDKTKATATAVSTTKITITWPAVPTATRYVVYRSVDGKDPWARVGAVEAGYPTYMDDTNCGPGEKWFYKVVTVNTDIGEAGTDSDVVNATTMTDGVLNLIATPVSKGQIDLDWDKLATAKTYTVYRTLTNANPASWIQIAKDLAANSYDDKDAKLLPGTTYFYRVYAVNDGGQSAPAEAYSTTLPIAPTVTATALSPDSVRLDWNRAICMNAVNYSVSISTDDGTTWIPLPNPDTTASFYIHDKDNPFLLRANTKYTYKVDVTDTVTQGSVPCANVSVTTLLPSLNSLFATASSNTQIDLRWSKDDGATGYMLYRSNTGETGFFEQIQDITNKDTNTYSDKTNLIGATTYWYQLRKKNAGGLSAPSNFASDTTFPNKPDNFFAAKEAGKLTNHLVTLTWNAVPGAMDYILTRKQTSPVAETVEKTIAVNETQVGNVFTAEDTTVDGGCTYEYLVYATNHPLAPDGKIQGTVSDKVTILTVPNAPDFLVANADSATQITLTWGAVVGAKSFQIERWENANGPLLTNPDQVKVTDGNSTTYKDIDKKPGTEYFYQIRAINDSGTSTVRLATSSETTYAPIVSPVLNQVSVETAAKITLSWSPVTGATGYKIYKSTAVLPLTGYTEVVDTEPAAITGATTTATVTALTPDTIWYFRVAAIGAGNIQSGLSNYGSGKTLPLPGAPQLKSLTVLPTGIEMRWDSIPKATKYIVMKIIDGAPDTNPPTVVTADTLSLEQSYIDTAAVSGHGYRYKVLAVNELDDQSDPLLSNTQYIFMP